MCLRQYLYRDGDQCEWNTGGWIKCKEDAIAYIGAIPNSAGPTSTGVVSKKLEFSDSSILLSGSVSANAIKSGSYYIRGGGLVNANIGTSKPLPVSIQKYASLLIAGSNDGVKYNIRTGTINDINTTTSTATILQSGSGDHAELALADYKPYLVIGKTLNYPAQIPTYSIPNINDSFSAEITEIYLV